MLFTSVRRCYKNNAFIIIILLPFNRLTFDHNEQQ